MPGAILWMHFKISFAGVTICHITCCLRVHQPVAEVFFGSLVDMPPSLSDVPITKERLALRQSAFLTFASFYYHHVFLTRLAEKIGVAFSS